MWLAVLVGCGSGDTGGTPTTAARPGGSLEAVRTKLRLVQQDPCYTAPDVAGQWPRCGRWEEEVRSVANAAKGARPDDPEITDPAAAVEAGHAQFLRAGCTAGAVPADPGACVAAIDDTRIAVTRLAAGVAAAR